ncbi:hypothetical protein TELCIR_23143, partial [Teladorsagia circumcincta]
AAGQGDSAEPQKKKKRVVEAKKIQPKVSPDEIDEYLEEEIKEECSKYGDVQEVVIANDQGAGIVKIFVRFADPKQ